jgi:hypothetical protein
MQWANICSQPCGQPALGSGSTPRASWDPHYHRAKPLTTHPCLQRVINALAYSCLLDAASLVYAVVYVQAPCVRSTLKLLEDRRLDARIPSQPHTLTHTVQCDNVR